MSEMPRRWRVLAAGIGACAAGAAGVLGFAGTTASAEPVLPQPTLPAPATITQTVTVAPGAAPQAVIGQSGVTPGTAGPAAVPAGITAPAAPAAPAVPPAPPATIAPASTGTLSDFFAANGVALEPQSSTDFRALNIVLPMPRGWSHVPDPNVPDAFAVIADRVGGNGLYTSNAQVVVYKLIGEFDPKEAISHGFIDSQQLPAWRSTDASLADFGGMPSSVIEGTYRENAMTLNTSRRHVIATSGTDRYLVSLSVTTSVDQVVAAASATDAIVNGFKVSVPSATPPVPPVPGLPIPAAPAPAAPVAPVAAPQAPAAPAVAAPPQMLGLQG
ncbi:LpqN/LpqT family lipoprotein [Mycobacterium sp. Y57]|uniref:LpqN/LpqT family lipoprotein n=1 Tax=Mycolicibacterium xanthum TaxID=2796469 RepID=UPI001C8522B7|nr:LpqN/LpqT family lipoprotein [Mycolicibacterium xanthum]MBX7433716.1 LpqN/LpqT family lipoprotein [Mycolicibacterium xanthum]